MRPQAHPRAIRVTPHFVLTDGRVCALIETLLLLSGTHYHLVQPVESAIEFLNLTRKPPWIRFSAFIPGLEAGKEGIQIFACEVRGDVLQKGKCLTRPAMGRSSECRKRTECCETFRILDIDCPG